MTHAPADRLRPLTADCPAIRLEDVVDPFGIDIVAEHNAAHATAQEMSRQVAALREAFTVTGVRVTREVLQLWLHLLADLAITATARNTTTEFTSVTNGEPVDAVAVRIAAVVALAREERILPNPEPQPGRDGGWQ